MTAPAVSCLPNTLRHGSGFWVRNSAAAVAARPSGLIDASSRSGILMPIAESTTPSSGPQTIGFFTERHISTGSIASATAELIDKWQQGRHHWGTYHLTCQGETSWFGFASAIAEHLRAAGRPCARLRPIPSSEYPTPAQRPLNSRLDGERLEQTWQIRLPDWRAALDTCLQRMN